MKSANQHIKDLEHVRDWLHSHPNKVDQDVRPAAIDWVKGELEEMKAGITKNSLNGVGAAETVRKKTKLGFIHSIISGRKSATIQ